MSGPMGGRALSGRNFSNRGGNFSRRGNFAFNGKHHDHGHGHHHRRNFVAFGGPFYDDYYDYGYGGGCGWLYQTAINTGSSYWWRRYELCESY